VIYLDKISISIGLKTKRIFLLFSSVAEQNQKVLMVIEIKNIDIKKLKGRQLNKKMGTG